MRSYLDGKFHLKNCDNNAGETVPGYRPPVTQADIEENANRNGFLILFFLTMFFPTVMVPIIVVWWLYKTFKKGGG